MTDVCQILKLILKWTRLRKYFVLHSQVSSAYALHSLQPYIRDLISITFFIITSPLIASIFGVRQRSEESDNLLKDDLLAVAIRCSANVMSVQTLNLFDQLLRCCTRLHTPSTVPHIMVLQSLLCRITCSNNVIFRCVMVASIESCDFTTLRILECFLHKPSKILSVVKRFQHIMA